MRSYHFRGSKEGLRLEMAMCVMAATKQGEEKNQDSAISNRSA